jgi:hypothetical protein
MRVACLQFAPEVGKVQDNLARADSILHGSQLPSDIDWLVLPELAFTGKHTEHVRLQCGRKNDRISIRIPSGRLLYLSLVYLDLIIYIHYCHTES